MFDEVITRMTRRQSKPIGSLIVWIVLASSIVLFISHCGFDNRVFQQAWKGGIWSLKEKIQAYINKNGRIPDALDEVFPTEEEREAIRIGVKGKSVNITRWAHYKRISDNEYLIWLSRAELINDFAESQTDNQHNRPVEGDVFARVSKDGTVLENSWSP